MRDPVRWIISGSVVVATLVFDHFWGSAAGWSLLIGTISGEFIGSYMKNREIRQITSS